MKRLKVIVGFECSGRVRDAFSELGHQAYSVDLQPCETGAEFPLHIQQDLFECLGGKFPDTPRGFPVHYFDIGIFHPPCTDLASSGARWFAQKRADGRQQAAIDLFLKTVEYATRYCKAWAIENPIGIMSTQYLKPDQIIQPWQFGHGETKATCLWLHNLPKLTATDKVEGRTPRVWLEPPGPDRARNRSRTYERIAAAMAAQWGAQQETKR